MSLNSATGTAEVKENSLSNVSPFSLNSNEEDNLGFKGKLNEEKEKNRKLNEKLDGYKTIVNQYYKEQQEKLKLKQTIAALEKELLQKSQLLVENQTQNLYSKSSIILDNDGEVLSELPHPSPQLAGYSSRCTNNSASFVVIQQFDQGKGQSTVLPAGLNSKPIIPCSAQSSLTAISNIEAQNCCSLLPINCNQEESTCSLDIEKINFPDDKSISLSEPKETAVSSKSFLDTETRKENSFFQLHGDSVIKIKSMESGISVQPHEVIKESCHVSLCSTVEHSSIICPITVTAFAGQSVKPQWQRQQEALLALEGVNQLTTQTTPVLQSHAATSQSSSKKGPTIPHAITTPAPAELTLQQSTSHLPLNIVPPESLVSPQSPLPPHTSAANTPHVPVTTVSGGHLGETKQTWGVGARPKECNNLVGQNFPLVPHLLSQTSGPPLVSHASTEVKWSTHQSGQQHGRPLATVPEASVQVPLLFHRNSVERAIPLSNTETCISSSNVGPTETGGIDESSVLVHSQQRSGSDTTQIPLSFSQATSSSFGLAVISGMDQSKVIISPSHEGKEIKTERKYTDTWVKVDPDDLMNFPSLKSLSSPKTYNTTLPEQQIPYNVTTSMDQSKVQGHSIDRKILDTPSEDETQLASQAHSMAAELSHQSGISKMLYEFAQKASRMEEKLARYQALIQRQQIQIQSQHNCEQELHRLRKENETLVIYLNETQPFHAGVSVGEGWTVIEKATAAGDRPAHHTLVQSELLQRLQSVEKVNVRLFQANKDWHSKWEALRQQARQEQVGLEADLRARRLEVDKGQADLRAMDNQLKEAVRARQEEKKRTLNLEQEKLNLMRELESNQTELENWRREKRELQAELNTLRSLNRLKEKENVGKKTIGELRSENELLQQQVEQYHDDFLKEQVDKATIQSRADKLRRERELLKTKLASTAKELQKSRVLIKTKDDDICQKSRHAADLQCQLDDLRKQVQREKRKPQDPTILSVSSTTLDTQTPCVVYPNSTVPGAGGIHTVPLTQNSNSNTKALQHTAAPAQHQLSPEHLPGAWQCKACTFINFPERKVCDICGTMNVPGTRLQYPEATASGRGGDLESRGEDGCGPGYDVPDVVPDTPVGDN